MIVKEKKRLLLTISLLLFLLAGANIFTTIPVVKADPDSLIILHPHSSGFANDVIEDFQEWYEDTYSETISVSTIMKSSGACYSTVEAWAGSPEADVWWGGGEYYFKKAVRSYNLFLEAYNVTDDANIVDEFGGWDLKDPDFVTERRWYAAALSSFGFMWNKEYLTANNLPEPETWEDLTKPIYKGHITMCDPAKSGSTTATVLIVIQHFISQAGWDEAESGYEEAWEYWANVTGNVGLFLQSSHAVPLYVVRGDYGIGITIDYYAWEQEIAGMDVGFALGGGTTISADPVAILNGTARLPQAKAFMDYITSKRGQEAVGKGRMPIREDAAATAPILSAWLNATSVPVIEDFNVTAYNVMYSNVREMFANWLTKNHGAAKSAYGKILECEDLELRDDEDYQAAVSNYTALPDVSDTYAEILAIESDDLIDLAGPWETWGATHFASAATSADAAIAEAGNGEEPPPDNRVYIYAGVVIVIAVAAAYLFLRRR